MCRDDLCWCQDRAAAICSPDHSQGRALQAAVINDVLHPALAVAV